MSKNKDINQETLGVHREKNSIDFKRLLPRIKNTLETYNTTIDTTDKVVTSINAFLNKKSPDPNLPPETCWFLITKYELGGNSRINALHALNERFHEQSKNHSTESEDSIHPVMKKLISKYHLEKWYELSSVLSFLDNRMELMKKLSKDADNRDKIHAELVKVLHTIEDIKSEETRQIVQETKKRFGNVYSEKLTQMRKWQQELTQLNLLKKVLGEMIQNEPDNEKVRKKRLELFNKVTMLVHIFDEFRGFEANLNQFKTSSPDQIEVSKRIQSFIALCKKYRLGKVLKKMAASNSLKQALYYQTELDYFNSRIKEVEGAALKKEADWKNFFTFYHSLTSYQHEVMTKFGDETSVRIMLKAKNKDKIGENPSAWLDLLNNNIKPTLEQKGGEIARHGIETLLNLIHAEKTQLQTDLIEIRDQEAKKLTNTINNMEKTHTHERDTLRVLIKAWKKSLQKKWKPVRHTILKDVRDISHKFEKQLGERSKVYNQRFKQIMEVIETLNPLYFENVKPLFDVPDLTKGVAKFAAHSTKAAEKIIPYFSRTDGQEYNNAAFMKALHEGLKGDKAVIDLKKSIKSRFDQGPAIEYFVSQMEKITAYIQTMVTYLIGNSFTIKEDSEVTVVPNTKQVERNGR